MKTINLGRKIEMTEGIKPEIGLLVDTPELRQEIIKEDGKLILRSHEVEKTEKYSSVMDIDVYLEEKDILIKCGNGYTKPVRDVIELTEEEEEAIETINKKLI